MAAETGTPIAQRQEVFDSGSVKILDVLHRLLYRGVEVVPGGGYPAITPGIAGYVLSNDGVFTEWIEVPILPAIDGSTTGKYLTNDGSVPSWSSIVTSGLAYQGTWDASTNTPAIPAAGSGNNGYYYKVSTAGSTTIDGISDWGVGDWIISNGTVWQKIDNSDMVSSVAGKVGAVILYKADITDFAHTHPQSEITNLVSDLAAKQATITGAASTITSSNLTASRALVSDGSGKVGVSIVSSTELGYMSGVTSSVQTQLNSKEPTIATGTSAQYIRGDKALATLDKTAVGLGNVANALQLVAANNLSDLVSASAARTNLGLGSLAVLSSVNNSNWVGAQLTIANGGTGLTSVGTSGQALVVDGGGSALIYQTIDKTWVGLGNVENTALSTWAGTTNITTLGTVATGTWNASTIALNKGGTGTSLTAPLTSRLMMYNVGTGLMDWVTLDSTLSLTGTTLGVVISGYAPSSASYVTMSTEAGLSNERYLAGTANRIVITDGGAGAPVTFDIGTDVVTLTASQSLQNKTLGAGTTITAAQMSLGSDAAGDIYYRNGSGALARLPIGLTGQSIRVDGAGTGLEYFSPSSGVTTTGSQAAGQIAYWTGVTDQISRGVPEFFFDTATSRLAVGFSSSPSPQSKVHVHVPSAASSHARFTNTNTGATSADGVVVGVDSNGKGMFWLYNNLDMFFGVNNAEAMRILANGKVGIGTNNPTSLFSVGGSSQFQVDSSGDIVRIKALAYAWPAAHAVGFAKNDGAGNLTWAAVTASDVGLGSVANALQLVAANNLSDLVSASTARTNLGLGSLAVLNTVNNGDWSGTALTYGNGGTGLTALGSPLQALTVNGAGTALVYATIDKTWVGLSNVENTALSTWAGTTNVTTLGTVTTGTWSGTAIAINKGGTGQTTANDALNALLPSQTGNNGKVLTTDGTNTSWTTPSGGGLTNWTDAINTAAPNATVPAASLTATNAATDVDAVVRPKGTGAFILAVPDNTATGGNKRGDYAVDLQLYRANNNEVASGPYAALVGGRYNKATGDYAANVGGQSNIASGQYSGIIGSSSVTASNDNAAGIGSYSTTIAGTSAVAVGTRNSAIAEDRNVFLGVLFGSANAPGVTSGVNVGAVVIGENVAPTWPKTVHIGSGYDPASKGNGAVQGEMPHVSKTTTDATPTQLDIGGVKLVIPNNTTYSVKALVTCRKPSTGDSATFDVLACIKRGANAASTTLVGSTTNSITDTALSACAVTVVADTTNGSINIEVTGIAATTLYWGAMVITSKISS